MKRFRTATQRKTKSAVLGTSNVYEELLAHEEQRNAAMQEQIEKHRQVQRVLEAKMAYLTKMQESHGRDYRPGRTELVFSAIGEDTLVIGDMPGWELPPDAWLGYRWKQPGGNVYFAIGADGLLYCSRTPSDRDSFNKVEHLLMKYSTGQLAQIADAIEAYTAQDPWKITGLMQSQAERLKAETGI